ncbi:hypothetical protein P43SY_001218 [Pythium insidiosum]|uniref:Transmembrane protein n=1 Tax=Pythium insidiosum TaxID=114742 RepID=A0AAD5LVF2_PYTIN|nr:hypothetical protein P43SY_001218 [Pythium insidiosum]
MPSRTRLVLRARELLPLIVDALVLVGLVCLDLRDLHYKVAWIGPEDTFSFYAVAARKFSSTPVAFRVQVSRQDVLPADDAVVIANGSEPLYRSGWPSLLAGCDAFYPAGSSTFIGGMGVNCSLGGGTGDAIPLFYMNARVRPDSMAWVACKLLFRHRRPTICSDQLVTGFTTRYGFEDRAPPSTLKAEPFSSAETELLALLLVIAKSEPLTQITCTEGFIYDGERGGTYLATLFGCGAPNVLQRAFVGLRSSAFAQLHQDKAWLTVDTIGTAGMRYVLRQNVRSEYTLRDVSTPGMTLPQRVNALALTSKTIVNFSSSGVLYNLMVGIDLVLLGLNLYSAVEIARLMIVPAVSARWRLTTSRHLRLHQHRGVRFRSLLTSSLYRSPIVIVLTVTTQLISWIIILPNSIIFTWSTSSRMAKLQAYLSSLRLWVLLLIVLNALWDTVALVSERTAYLVTSRTFIRVSEVLLVGAVVSYALRQRVFEVTGLKYDLEMQRTKDNASFIGTTALTNAYNEQLDFVARTPADVLWLVYRPLVVIIAWSLFACLVLLSLRALFHAHVKPLVLRCLLARRATSRVAAVSVVPAKGRVVSGRAYARLPLETVLNDPIRARCLVRSSLEMEVSPADGVRTLSTEVFLEYGVVIDGGRVRYRYGFCRSIEPTIGADACISETEMDTCTR